MTWPFGEWNRQRGLLRLHADGNSLTMTIPINPTMMANIRTGLQLVFLLGGLPSRAEITIDVGVSKPAARPTSSESSCSVIS
jgi:hypothetical protein